MVLASFELFAALSTHSAEMTVPMKVGLVRQAFAHSPMEHNLAPVLWQYVIALKKVIAAKEES